MKRSYPYLKAISTLFLLLSLPAGWSVSAVPAAQSIDLFTNAGIEGDWPADGPAVVRARFVNVQWSLLDGGGPWRMNLFDNVAFWAEPDRVERTSEGLHWVGHLRDVAYSQVILARRGNSLVGSVSLPGALYQVRAVGGVHAVSEIDQRAFPHELPPIPVSPPAADVPGVENNTVAADDGSLIDVLVVYTDDARAALGGTTQIENLIDLAVLETNTGYENGNVTQRVRLVHTAEVSYDESDLNWSTTLARLRQSADGVHGQHPRAARHLWGRHGRAGHPRPSVYELWHRLPHDLGRALL